MGEAERRIGDILRSACMEDAGEVIDLVFREMAAKCDDCRRQRRPPEGRGKDPP